MKMVIRMAKKKYYGVKVGKKPGVYLTWEECKSQVDGFSGAVYKSFPSLDEAEEFAGVHSMNRAMASAEPGVSECGAAENELQPGVTAELEFPSSGATAYVDGSYNAATGEYSCGVVFLYEGKEIHIAQKGEREELASMRNVAGEILGAELAMRKAVEMGITSLSIYHDYQGIASWCLGEWKTNKEGTRAYKEYFDSISRDLKIRFVKVKGHSGDKYNDMADELAKSVIF